MSDGSLAPRAGRDSPVAGRGSGGGGAGAPLPRLPDARVGRLAFLAATAVGLLFFLYRYFDRVAVGQSIDVREPLVTEFTGAYGAALLMVFLVPFIRRYPLTRGAWIRRLPAYAVAALLFGLFHTTFMWLSRELLFPVVGLGNYDYGNVPARYAMEFPLQVMVVAIATGFVHVLDGYRESRNRELRARELESRLTRAQLQALQSQLQPHFLFNALNTISSTMYEDVDAADRMISRLSDLLRHALRTNRSQTISLREELTILEPYLDLMRARFGERLLVEFDVAEETLGAAVPALLLQPLVENAAEHGAPEPPLPAHIVIGSSMAGDRLVIEVRDNGRGLAPGAELFGSGVGITNLAGRLQALYGDAATLEWENDRGLVVRVRLPYTTAGADPVSEEGEWIRSAS